MKKAAILNSVLIIIIMGFFSKSESSEKIRIFDEEPHFLEYQDFPVMLFPFQKDFSAMKHVRNCKGMGISYSLYSSSRKRSWNWKAPWISYFGSRTIHDGDSLNKETIAIIVAAVDKYQWSDWYKVTTCAVETQAYQYVSQRPADWRSFHTKSTITNPNGVGLHILGHWKTVKHSEMRSRICSCRE